MNPPENPGGLPAAAAQEPARATLIIVEDDAAILRRMIEEVLSGADSEVVAVESSQAALDYLEGHEVAVVVTDLRMPRVGGLEVLRFAKRRSAMTQVILLTGHATVESAVDALKNGAYDYLKKPFEPDDLRRIVDHALGYWRLNRENLRLRETNRESAHRDGCRRARRSATSSD